MGKARITAMVLVCLTLALQTTMISIPAVQACSLDIDVDVGSIHFRGEMAEFYVLVSYSGEPVDNASISAMLYYNGTLHANLTTSVEYVAKGLYRVPYTIPINASAGTYAMVVEATKKAKCSYTLNGIALESFLLSPTLTDMNARIIAIESNVTRISIPDVGEILVKLDLINATLTDLIISAKGEILAKIDSALGVITVNLDIINAKLVALNGTIATIQTDIGIIKKSIQDIQPRITNIEGDIATISTILGDIDGTIVSIQEDIANIRTDIGEIKISLPPTQPTTLGIPVASALAGIAAVGSIVSVVLLLRKRKVTKY